jgi:tetratricopeptide (TPR) repeat protein
MTSSNGPESSARQDAAPYYGDAYNDVAKAKKDLADGKSKNVEKRFRRAIERGQHAVEIDSTYHEAWNLLGYCYRQVKQYDESVASYQRSLRIKPDYAEAREYLGETYLAIGKIDLAREQLAWLEKNNATQDATDLKTQVDAWVAAHPDAEAKPATAPEAAVPAGSASADSTANH